MATPNPSANTFKTSSPPQISKNQYTIAGILVNFYGLDELPSETADVACLWLLHARLQTQAAMEPFAAVIIQDWNKRIREGRTGSKRPVGLIGVSFDQRNHGSRQVNALANEAWRSGNPTHAQDMFSSYRGTVVDLSLLLDHVPSYTFPTNNHVITRHLALGISLGGHAAWHVILHEPRVTTAIVCVGCADFQCMMTDRARLSKLPSYVRTTPPGKSFIGSKDFPPALAENVKKYDAAALLLSQVDATETEDYKREPTEKEKVKLIPIMRGSLAGKRILNLAGGADKMVPLRVSETFLSWLKRAVGKGGWFSDQGVVFEDISFDGVGHEVTIPMVNEMVRFVGETLTGVESGGRARESKL